MTPPPWVFIDLLPQYVGQTVELRGWLYTRRSSGGIHFLLVRDGTGVVQAVINAKEVDAATFDRADHLPQESSLILTGAVRPGQARPRRGGGDRAGPRGPPGGRSLSHHT